MRKHLAMLSIGLSSLSAGAAPAHSIPKTLAIQVDGLFAAWNRPDSPGCALGILKNGAWVYRRGYGIADLEHDVPLTEKSVFYMASTSKQFTAASVILLAQQGKLSFGDDIRKYLPEIPQYPQTIRVANLVYQTSGLRDYLTLMAYADWSLEDEFNNDDALRLLSRQTRLNFPSGTQFRYSNSNYVLLAQIVRRVTGKSLRDFTVENIFKPLGMADTHFDDDHRQVVKQRVVSYAPAGPSAFRQFIKSIDGVGDGNLLSTIDDLARWERNFYDERVGGAGFTRQMTTRGTLDDGSSIEYAAGLFPRTYRGLDVVEHSGGFLGFRTQLLRFPAQRVSVACLCNLETINSRRLANEVADLYLAHEGVLLGPTEESATATAPAIVPSTFLLSESELKAYTGRYHSDELDFTHTIVVENGTLRLQVRHPWGVLVPAGKDEFQISDHPDVAVMKVKFVRDARGQVTEFDMDSERAASVRFTRSE